MYDNICLMVRKINYFILFILFLFYLCLPQLLTDPPSLVSLSLFSSFPSLASVPSQSMSPSTAHRFLISCLIVSLLFFPFSCLRPIPVYVSLNCSTVPHILSHCLSSLLSLLLPPSHSNLCLPHLFTDPSSLFPLSLFRVSFPSHLPTPPISPLLFHYPSSLVPLSLFSCSSSLVSLSYPSSLVPLSPLSCSLVLFSCLRPSALSLIPHLLFPCPSSLVSVPWLSP